MCTLATLFFALVMKIGFLEAEDVSEELINGLLVGIMLLPLAVASFIIGMAMHEVLKAKCESRARSLSARAREFGSYLASP